MHSPKAAHSEQFLHLLMTRQLRLSVACAASFLAVLFGLPLLNYCAPEFMARRVGGFTVSWLLLGVLMFPYVWVISAVFIRRSIALERAEVEIVRRDAAASTTPEPPAGS
jgi:uncharacterized membrane protein (DUF485 family)